MGRSILIMLLLLAFGPNGEKPTSHKDEPSPPAGIEAPAPETNVPELLEAAANRAVEVLSSIPPEIWIDQEREMSPSGEVEASEQGKENE